MKTQPNKWIVALGFLSLVIAVTALVRSEGVSFTHSAVAATRGPLPAMDTTNPAYEYARLVFTVGGLGTTIWLNTPTDAQTASLDKNAAGKFSNITESINSTAPDVSFPDRVPVNDMMLVQWMGLTKWELVAVTQNQVDIGVTTSYYFRRKT